MYPNHTFKSAPHRAHPIISLPLRGLASSATGRAGKEV